jgi:hypothetical protein
VETPSRRAEYWNPHWIFSCDGAHSVVCQRESTIFCVKLEIHSVGLARYLGTDRRARVASVLLLLTMAWFGLAVAAQVVVAPQTHTTIVVFSDRPMQPGQWATLHDALRASLVNGGEEAQTLDGDAMFLRGDEVEPGMVVDSAIVVYLHGNCELEPLVRRTAFGVPLGWVLERHGRIEPFAHVDCTRIGQVLGPQARGIARDRRNTMMADAMARVIMHEWIHIATQRSAHAEQGIERAQFGAADLLYGDSHPALSVRNR